MKIEFFLRSRIMKHVNVKITLRIIYIMQL